MAPSATYRDALTCAECGFFLSRHDEFCSKWTEPSEPLDVDAPITYVLTDRGRSACAAAPVR
jgi:hypothetical protein